MVTVVATITTDFVPPDRQDGRVVVKAARANRSEPLLPLPVDLIS